jgi:hypothetical protein
MRGTAHGAFYRVDVGHALGDQLGEHRAIHIVETLEMDP